MINPIYNEDDIQIYCGDCLKILPQKKQVSLRILMGLVIVVVPKTLTSVCS